MSGISFKKIGGAYAADLDHGDERFWLRRINGRWNLIWQHRDPLGDRMMSRLGTYTNLAAAKKEAEILAAL